MSPPTFSELAVKLGQLVTEKNEQYGDSAAKSGEILRALYPEGIKPHQMADALLVVRVLDKLCRIAQRGEDGRDKGGESPWQDIAGYGLIGWRQDVEAASDRAAILAASAQLANSPCAHCGMSRATRWLDGKYCCEECFDFRTTVVAS